MSVKRETVEERKALPLASGVLDYFPDALLAVAEVSRVGNEQHHPGEPLHWDKSKSTDEADALLRHLLDRGTRDTDGLRHSGKVAWRALALLQRELDAEATAEADRILTPAEVQREVLKANLEGTLRSLGIPRPTAEANPPQQCDWENTGVHDPWCKFVEVVEVPEVQVTLRGDWPPDTRVGGLLTCCGQSEHPLDCPNYRS